MFYIKLIIKNITINKANEIQKVAIQKTSFILKNKTSYFPSKYNKTCFHFLENPSENVREFWKRYFTYTNWEIKKKAGSVLFVYKIILFLIRSFFPLWINRKIDVSFWLLNKFFYLETFTQNSKRVNEEIYWVKGKVDVQFSEGKKILRFIRK